MNPPQGNVKRTDELNPTQGSLLGFLHAGPKTGWDLMQEAAAGLRRFWNVTQSHVYRELRVLEQRKLIKAGDPGPRERRPFALTSAGRRAFAAWVAQPPGPEQIRFPLLVTLWFGEHVDTRTLAGFVADARVEHEGRLALYRDVRDQLGPHDPHVGAVLQFGIRYEEAVLTWLDDILADAALGLSPRSGARPRV